MSPKEIVQDIYAAFGAGDIPRILGHLADDVQWEYGRPDLKDIPWLGSRRGHAGAMEFFESLGAFEFTKFTVNQVIGDGPTVIGLIDIGATVKATGEKLVEEDEVHVWHFNGAGKVVRFKHAVDTLQHWRLATARATA